MYTKKVTYEKEFLSGILEGLRVQCEFPTTTDALNIHMVELNQITKLNPAIGALTRDLFLLYNLGSQDTLAL